MNSFTTGSAEKNLKNPSAFVQNGFTKRNQFAVLLF